jgi:hypothetical protein
MAPTITMPRDGRPVCADPQWLPIVDAAFAQPGGPEGHSLAARACAHCPVAAQCLLLAMTSGEHGPWGGTIRKTRSQGRRSKPLWNNLKGIDHGPGSYPTRKAAA